MSSIHDRIMKEVRLWLSKYSVPNRQTLEYRHQPTTLLVSLDIYRELRREMDPGWDGKDYFGGLRVRICPDYEHNFEVLG